MLSISLIVNGGRLFSDFPQESTFDLKVGTCCFSNRVLFNVTAAGCGNMLSRSFISSVFVSAKNLLSRLPGVKFEILFSSVTNNFRSSAMGRLISTNNKLIMFLLSVSTPLFAIFILFYHVRPRFHVNDLLRNRIWEKRIWPYLNDGRVVQLPCQIQRIWYLKSNFGVK